MPSNDLAIYSPGSAPLYESASGGDDRRGRAGGAELQTKLLARTLAERGRSIAHIVWSLQSSAREVPAGVTLVERGDHREARDVAKKVLELWSIWRSMSVADARVYLFRGSGVQLFVGALFCRLRGRRLLFAAANDLDFDLDRNDRSRWFMSLYRLGLKEAAEVVVQTSEQEALAPRAGIDPDDVTLIRSFAEPAELSEEAPRQCLWAGRLVDYKRPLEYVRLAEALPSIEFLMVAAETTETSRELGEAVKEAGRRLPNLTVMPTMARSKVLAEINRSFAVISTSSHEGMPNVFLEAWARGIPTASLSFDPDGRIEQCKLGFACGDRWPDFVAAVSSLCEDRELRAAFSERVSRYVRETHSIDAVARRWDEVLARMLAG